MYTTIFETREDYDRHLHYFNKLQEPNPCIGCLVQAMNPPCFSERCIEEEEYILLIALRNPCPPALEWFKKATQRELNRLKRRHGVKNTTGNFWKLFFSYFHGHWDNDTNLDNVINCVKSCLDINLFWEIFKESDGP